MLSEHPNVRVHDDPAIMCLLREAVGHDVRAPFLWFVSLE